MKENSLIKWALMEQLNIKNSMCSNIVKICNTFNYELINSKFTNCCDNVRINIINHENNICKMKIKSIYSNFIKKCIKDKSKLKIIDLSLGILKTPLYLYKITDPSVRRNITKFRTSNHYLPIETGRISKVKIPPDKRICTLCQSNTIGNEFHALIKCNELSNIRSRCFNEIYKIIPQFSNFDDNNKFQYLIGFTDISIYKPTSLLLSIILKSYKDKHFNSV